MAESNSKPYGIVYCIENTINGKRYIGQTIQPMKRRFAAHGRRDCCSALYRAIGKYGAAAFQFFILDEAVSKDHLDALEDFYIRILGTTNRDIGYNLRGGGSFGKHTAESKLKMSEKVKAAYISGDLTEKRRVQKTGQKLTDLQKQALVMANIGKKASAEAKRKMSDARKTLWSEAKTRENMRQASIAARAADDYKTAVSISSKKQWQDPDARARMLESRAKTQDQGNAARTAAWRDPVKRAARMAKIAATRERNRAGKSLQL